MKKLLFSLLLLSTVTVSFAGSYGMAGCGPGSMLIGDKSKGSQMLAAVIDDGLFLNYIVPETNGIQSIKLFAITTGTSNCEDDGISMNEEEQNHFVEANYEEILVEAAKGEGDNIAALSNLMGCNESVTPLFIEKTQEQYSDIFSQESSHDVVISLDAMIQDNDELSTQCSVSI